MKFDKIVKKIILEVTGQTVYPDRNATYKLNPENALAKLADAYDFLKNNAPDTYDSNVGNAAMQIALTVRDSNLNSYQVKDGTSTKTIAKSSLLKDVLTFCSNYGNRTFEVGPKLVIPGMEKSGKREKAPRGPYTVPPAKNEIPLLRDKDGDSIPAGTQLAGSDYRLSMYNNTEEIKRHGGIEKLHHVYREIFPILGIRYQEFNRAGREARIEGQAAGEPAMDIQSIPVYWWGENFLPYRTVLKVRDGKVLKVEKMNEPLTKAAGINWRTDRFGKQEKPRPLVSVGSYKGAYDGDMQYGKTVDEVRRAIQFSDFEPVKKEAEEISNLFKSTKTDPEAKVKLRDLIRRQEAYNALSPEEKKNLYTKRIKQYNTAYAIHPPNTIRPEITERPEDAYPYFTIFHKDSNGKYKFKAASAEQKFKQLYPESELPEFYTDK
jgi:hypothetical protein